MNRELCHPTKTYQMWYVFALWLDEFQAKKILFYATNISEINISVNIFHMKVNKCFQVDESFFQGKACEKFLILAKI